MLVPTTAVLDTFNRADETPIAGNWSSPIVTTHLQPRLLSNAMAANAGDAESSAWWNVQQFAADQECYVTMTVKPNDNNNVVLYLRNSHPGVDATNTGYSLQYKSVAAANDQLQIFRIDVNDVTTSLTSNQVAEWQAGDKVLFRAVGTTLEGWRYDVVAQFWRRHITTTDANYNQAGYVGLNNDSVTIRLGDFGGGEVGATDIATDQSFLPKHQLVGIP